jgi:hypothetical protein
MHTSFNSLSRLLGQKDTDSGVVEFIRQISDDELIDTERHSARHLWCTRDGLLIEFWKRECVSICFHMWTAAVEAGNMRPYGGDLPFGILSTDSREQVKDKIGLTPESSVLPGSQDRPNECWRDEYHLGEHKYSYSFVFDSITGELHLLTARMSDAYES